MNTNAVDYCCLCCSERLHSCHRLYRRCRHVHRDDVEGARRFGEKRNVRHAVVACYETHGL